MIKNFSIYLITLLFVLLFLPATIVRSCTGPPSFHEEVGEKESIVINVLFHNENEVKAMYLEDYIAGVVAGEMPASFDIEALKAQAVIARTYAVARMKKFGGAGYGEYSGADICDDFRHSQHYITEDEAKANWSIWQRNSNWDKIVEAVYSTKGEIITYQGKPIDALYHSTCGGATENSEDVFTNKIAYLRGVECDYCNDSTRLNQRVTYTKDEFISLLKEEELQDVFTDGGIDMQPVSTTPNDRIIHYRLGEKTIRGTDARNLFNLNSSRFTYNYDGSNVVFDVIGYGHGVGMCQYGSNGLAKEGHSYKDIIDYYYKGVDVINISSSSITLD